MYIFPNTRRTCLTYRTKRSKRGRRGRISCASGPEMCYLVTPLYYSCSTISVRTIMVAINPGFVSLGVIVRIHIPKPANITI